MGFKVSVRNPFTGKKQDVTPRIDGDTGKNIVKNTVGMVAPGVPEAVTKGYDKTIGAAQKKERESRKERDALMDEALGYYDDLKLPEFDMSDFAHGVVSDQSGTEFDKISTDPGLRQAQMNALKKLEQIGNSNGLLDVDKALLAKTQRDAAMQDRGRREAILQNAAARGMAGTGNELLAQLSSSQAATDRSNQAGLDIAGMAQQRALDSIAKAGTLGGQIRGQEFDEQAKRAAAQDAINNFNAGQRTKGSFDNAGITNDQKKYHNDVRQTGFQNAKGIVQDKANITQGKAANSNTDANRERATQGSYIDMFGNIVKAGAKA